VHLPLQRCAGSSQFSGDKHLPSRIRVCNPFVCNPCAQSLCRSCLQMCASSAHCMREHACARVSGWLVAPKSSKGTRARTFTPAHTQPPIPSACASKKAETQWPQFQLSTLTPHLQTSALTSCPTLTPHLQTSALTSCPTLTPHLQNSALTSCPTRFLSVHLNHNGLWSILSQES